MKTITMFLLFLALSFNLLAQPTTITWQGKLLDAAGNAITQNNVAMTFAMFDASTAGNQLWPASGVVTKTVDVLNGLYSVHLGTGTGDDIAFTAAMFNGQTPWLEVKVGTETLPRTEITNVPFALISNKLSSSGWESPGEIGKTTANTGKFTSVETGSVKITTGAEDGKVLTSDADGDASWETLTPADISAAEATHSHDDATSSTAGFMSSGDKTKLDGIEVNANNYTHPTGDGNLHVPATGTTNNGKILTAGSTAGSISWQTLPSAPVTSVAGKTGDIILVNTDVGLGNVENTALSTWEGSTHISTLGTIVTGTWNGTAIDESYVGNLSASKITSGTFNNARINWAVPGNIGSTTPASGAFTSVSANNGLAVANGTVNIKPSGSGGTNGQVLTTNGSGNATWQNTKLANFEESNFNHSPRFGVKLQAVYDFPDVDLVISPKGAGAILADQPDGTADGGNIRGMRAIDLQMGRDNATQVASGSYAMILGGLWNTASGSYSIAMGFDNTASGQNSITMGSINNASGSSAIAIGSAAIASGYSSKAIGDYIAAPSAYETVLGRYNIDYTPASTTGWDANDRLFLVANGTSNVARSNALVILKNANTTIGGSLTINGNGTNTSIAFPTSRGTNGQVLTTDGIGGTSWAAPASGTVTGVSGTLPIVSTGGAAPVLSINAATPSTAGSMSGADKTKLDGLVTNATHTGDVTGSAALTISNKVTMTATSPISITGSPTVIATNPVAVSISAATTSTAGSMSAADKTKLDGIAFGAEVNVNPDWNATSGDAQIMNKPNLATVATSGNYNDLSNKPTTDGSETKVTAGTNISVTGTGTTASPYVVNATGATTLTIGQNYQGGIIFWLDATGQHGLIAATADQSTGIQWYNLTYRSTGTTGDGLYAGAMNTAMIIATQMADNEMGNFAAKVCADYSVTVGDVTFGDWYLPSKYELNLLYLQQTEVGGFADYYYWSSSENSISDAWRQNFGGGNQYNDFKQNTYYVRAVRAF
jgi:hypothetical protein